MRMVKARLEGSVRGKLGALLVKSALMELRNDIHYSQTGGALLVGVRGVVVLAHGKSDPEAIKNAILAADRFARADLTAKLAESIERHHRSWEEAAEVESA
jgi:glycerol-3-phosphate acyltransferase PlsX